MITGEASVQLSVFTVPAKMDRNSYKPSSFISRALHSSDTPLRYCYITYLSVKIRDSTTRTV